MRFSSLFAAAVVTATTGLAAPVPAGYEWTITDWSGGHWGPVYANFYVSGPQTTSGGITIPALSLSRRCTPVGAVGSVTDCSDLIVNNSDGRKLTATFQESSDIVTLVTYTFSSGGTTHKITGLVASAASGVSKSFTVTPNSLDWI